MVYNNTQTPSTWLEQDRLVTILSKYFSVCFFTSSVQFEDKAKHEREQQKMAIKILLFKKPICIHFRFSFIK